VEGIGKVGSWMIDMDMDQGPQFTGMGESRMQNPRQNTATGNR